MPRGARGTAWGGGSFPGGGQRVDGVPGCQGTHTPGYLGPGGWILGSLCAGTAGCWGTGVHTWWYTGVTQYWGDSVLGYLCNGVPL